jgi:16S rRNA (uracil1498-N3)-methyltransferase
MKNRFFVAGPLSPGSVVALDGDERHHARVLRIGEGEEVEVFDGRGATYIARFESADSIHVIGEAANREPRTAIHLAMSIIQLDKFEFVLQKATELGVHSIIPLIADRIEVRAERFRGKEERWRKIVFEATKQSGRSRIPLIESPAKFDEVIARAGSKIVFDGDTPPTPGPPDNPTTLFIGPEGGWSERELGLARANGAAWQRLGPRRLRSETAAIAALAVIAARSGDI